MRRLMFAAAIAAVSSVAFAATWYVDDDNYGKSGTDGASAATAFGTIQEAIDAGTTKEGDTICVLPGTYDRGVCTPEAYAAYGLKRPCRVFVTKDRLTIRATQGRDVTHVVGVRDATDAHGMGPASVACVYAYASTLVLDGITLRDGTVQYRENEGADGGNKEWDNGGGFGTITIMTTRHATLHLFDCAISNCASRAGAVESCTLHRCLVANNYSSKTQGVGLLYGKAENSVFVGNDGHAVGQSTLVNCVVTGTRTGKATTYSKGVYNSILAMNDMDRDSDKSGAFHGSVSCGADETYFPDARDSAFSVPATNLFVAPVLGDFRLVAGSAAIGRASPQYLADNIVLPAGYDFRDFGGRVIDMSAPAIDAGAFQGAVTPEGGCVQFVFSGMRTETERIAEVTGVAVNGHPFYHRSATYAYAAKWPAQWCVTAAPDRFLSCVGDGTESNANWSFADRSGRVVVTPPKVGATATANVQLAGRFYYVDPNAGDDGGDGSAAHPWRTLAHAASCATVNNDYRSVIYCAPGVYAEGSVDGRRVSIPNNGGRLLHFVATEGPERTFIVGAADSAAADGFGPNAVALVSSGNQWGTGLSGFTLTGGYTDAASSSSYGRKVGVVAFASSATLSLCDCVISNNFSNEGIDTGSVTFDRCLIAENTSKLIISGGRCRGCILRDNRTGGSDYGWIYRGAAINCLFLCTGGACDGKVLVGDQYRLPRVYNSIFYQTPGVNGAQEARGCLLDGCVGSVASKAGFVDCREGSALFAYAARGDWRLTPASDVGGLGVSDFDSFASLAASDLFGNPVVRDGEVGVGAVVEVAANGFGIADPSAFVVSGNVPAGCNMISEGETLTLAPNADSPHPVLGWEVGGVTNYFGDAASHSWTLADALAAPGGLLIRPVLGHERFVDAENGNDANTGFSARFPKRTLAAALANAVAGDTVWAAPGRYDEGTMNPSDYDTPARADVPEGVTLRSVEGKERTFIVGAAGSGDEGSGEGAVRCVFLRKGATVRGFTVTGGHVARPRGHADGNPYASGICSYTYVNAEDTFAEDCDISDCVAWRCVVMGGVLSNCRLLGNKTFDRGLGYGTSLRNCLISRNHLQASGGVFRDGNVDNVTFAGDNVFASDGSAFTGSFIDAFADKHVNNSVIFTKMDDGAVTNCVFVGGVIRSKFVGCRNLTAEDVALDADFRPILGRSALVDMGTNESGYLTDAAAWGATDLAGGPRVMNGTIDIGAFEADWRPRFAADIGRGVAVVDATPGVRETDGGTVSLGKDGSITVERARSSSEEVPFLFSFVVKGNGTLTIEAEGGASQTFTRSPEVQTCQIDGTGNSRIRLSYQSGENDADSAEILHVKRLIGLVILVR